MFSIQRLMGEDGKFFALLEASTEQACDSVRCLKEFLSAPRERSLNGFIATRRKEKAISQEISTSLCRSFVTPIEPEDIETISYALYRIPKTIEKFGERLMASGQTIAPSEFAEQLDLLEQATTTVQEMVKSLGDKPKLKQIKEKQERLASLEGAADKLMTEVLREFYGATTNLLSAMAVRDLHELIEKAIDRCRDVGNAIFRVVLKCS